MSKKEALDDYQKKVMQVLGTHKGDPLGTNDIAKQLDLPTAATASVLRSLERKGLVEEGHKQVEGPLVWKKKAA